MDLKCPSFSRLMQTKCGQRWDKVLNYELWLRRGHANIDTMRVRRETRLQGVGGQLHSKEKKDTTLLQEQRLSFQLNYQYATKFELLICYERSESVPLLCGLWSAFMAKSGASNILEKKVLLENKQQNLSSDSWHTHRPKQIKWISTISMLSMSAKDFPAAAASRLESSNGDNDRKW